jgi:hypothetical protein
VFVGQQCCLDIEIHQYSFPRPLDHSRETNRLTTG